MHANSTYVHFEGCGPYFKALPLAAAQRRNPCIQRAVVSSLLILHSLGAIGDAPPIWKSANDRISAIVSDFDERPTLKIPTSDKAGSFHRHSRLPGSLKPESHNGGYGK